MELSPFTKFIETPFSNSNSTKGRFWESENLVRFVQFKKCEKHPWKSDTFSKVTD